MNCTSFYPVIMTDAVAATAAFYVDHFRFAPAFTSDWYVHLTSTENPAINIAVLDHRHETVPAGYRQPVAGAILNFEVVDVDAVHARAQEEGWPIVQPLRDEPFGQRHFVTRDPAGTLVDIVTPIPPAAHFADAYSPEALAKLGGPA
jgi:catechol 2,3-dioxygenase-like lactoylglutathione lyase family enzyme